jgi:hypothetical protein
MNNAVLAKPDTKSGMTSLLGLTGLPPSASSTFAPGSSQASDAEEDVSVAGVMLLSAMSVLMAIAAMVTFALFVIGCWWALSHVPVRAPLHHLLRALHLTHG